jgi:hypothetical protein
MADRLDELLRRLPSDAMPADLPARIQLGLRAQRTVERRSRVLSDAAMAGLALIGLFALIPNVTGAGALPRLGTLESSTTWVGQFGAAPALAVWEALTGGLNFLRALAGTMGLEGVLGLILFSVPLFVWLRRLMPDRSRASDLAAGWPGMTQEEGVGA